MMIMTRKQRKPRRDNEVDFVRTTFWFRRLGDRLGTHKAREIQREIAPDTVGMDSTGEPIKNNKFLNYARGKRIPLARLVEQADQVVPYSAWALNHPLWQVLRVSGSIRGFALKWVRQLDLDVQRFALLNGEVSTSTDRHTLDPLERRAGMDSLAALTIMLRLSHEKENNLAVWEYAQVIHRVLLMLGPMLEQHTVAEQVFRIYVTRIFSLVSFEGQRIALENYDYLTKSQLLSMLADEVREQSEPQTARRLPSYYALQVLNGKRQQRARRLFMLPTAEARKTQTSS